MRKLFVLIGLLISSFSFCQDIGIYQEMKKKFPDEAFVQLSKKVNYIMKIEKEKLDVSMITSEKYIYLKNTAGFSVDRSVFSSEFNELTSFEANSYVPEKNKYKKIPVPTYKQKTNVGQNSFYDDIKELVFTFPGVSEGTIIELNTVHKVHEPRFLNITYLESFFPVLDFEVVFEYDPGVNLEVLKINMPDNYGTFSTTGEKSMVHYKWKNTDVKRLKSETNEADIKYFAAHFIPIIRSYKNGQKEVDVLTNTESLYKWYYTFIENFDEGIDETGIRKLTDSVTAGCTSELEKVEKLYFWVQENIKYIAFEYGLGGFIPRKPDVVLKNHYGDCKDKAALLHTLLRVTGIKSYFTWIGTNDIPYTYDEVSSPVTDNHMIITYIEGENYYFLDGTGRYLSLGFPTSFIQGKQALIAKEKDHFEIKTIPLMPPGVSGVRNTDIIEISDGKLKGTASSFFSGYQKKDLLYGFYRTDEKDKKEFMENVLEKGSNKFKLLDYQVTENKNLPDPVSVDYSFELDNYVNVLNDEIVINPNLNRDFLEYKLDENRKNPLAFDYCFTLRDEFKFVVPQGYSVEYLPSGSVQSGEKLEYSIRFGQSGDTIIYNHTLSLKDILIEKEFFGEWNNLIKGLEKAYKQSILLRKNEN